LCRSLSSTPGFSSDVLCCREGALSRADPWERLAAHDRALRVSLGGVWLAGIDEAGRGPLAGPVVAAAVVLPDSAHLPMLDDSKRLSPARRASLEGAIRAAALHAGLGRAEVEEIDRLGILAATFLAMERAAAELPAEAVLLVDGRDFPFRPRPGRALVGGDGLSACVAAASILAKQERDRELLRLHQLHPQYGFDRHKGYGTAAHLEALRRLGRCAAHRRSFRLPWERDALHLP